MKIEPYISPEFKTVLVAVSRQFLTGSNKGNEGYTGDDPVDGDKTFN